MGDDAVAIIRDLRAENERLRGMIDKHNSERRECPVIEP